MNDDIRASATIAGRLLLETIFVDSGVQKITGYAATVGSKESQGVPGALLPLVIATELGGGLLVALGLWTRVAAFAIAGFTLLSALLFHMNFQDQVQTIMFLKNLAIAGGFLVLVAHGAGRLSLDARRAGGVP